jgi:hypothetical protein
MGDATAREGEVKNVKGRMLKTLTKPGYDGS